MKKIFPVISAALVVGVLLTGCGPQQNQDRSSGAGSAPDSVYDTSHVEVYRNADNIPNVAYFCVGEFGWASTLSNDGESSPALVRFEEYDSVCSSVQR